MSTVERKNKQHKKDDTRESYHNNDSYDDRGNRYNKQREKSSGKFIVLTLILIGLGWSAVNSLSTSGRFNEERTITQLTGKLNEQIERAKNTKDYAKQRKAEVMRQTEMAENGGFAPQPATPQNHVGMNANKPKVGTSIEEYDKVTGTPSNPDYALIEARFKAQESEIFGKSITYQNYDKSLSLMKTLIDENIDVLGTDNLYMADAFFHMGQMHYSNKEYLNGERYLHNALNTYLSHLGPEHEFTGMTYANLGHTTYSQGAYKQALDYYQKSYTNLSKQNLERPEDLSSVKTMIRRTQDMIKKKEKGQ